jgi:small basic protein (TIGR04137 family)
MTMDKSLRVRAGMTRARSVLTRDERIKRLTDAERWKMGDSPFGLPKVRVYKLAMKKKKKKAKEDEEGADAAATAAAPAAGAKGAAAKGAAAKTPAAKAPAAKAPAAKGKK